MCVYACVYCVVVLVDLRCRVCLCSVLKAVVTDQREVIFGTNCAINGVCCVRNVCLCMF